MKKRVLMSLLLIAIGTSAVFAQADKLKFTAVSGGYSVAGISISVTRGEITIPDTYDGKPVVAIAIKGFQGMGGITSINIPKGVKIIPDNAFAGVGITSLTIPDNVIEIGNSAFAGCTSLHAITMGKNVTKIGSNAFKGCYRLDEFTGADIGASVQTIGTAAFEGCYSLRRVWIRDSIKSINASAFKGCTKLERVNFQKEGITVGNDSFPGDLSAKYKAEGKGRYEVTKRTSGGAPVNWEKTE